MKRIMGSMLLLAGLSGCISPAGNTGQGEKKTADNKNLTVPAPRGFVGQSASIPTNPTWTPHPDRQAADDLMAARMAPSSGLVRANSAHSVVPAPTMPTMPEQVIPAPRPDTIVQTAAMMATSIVPVVTTPEQFPASVPTVPMPRAESRAQVVTPVNATQSGDALSTSAKTDPAKMPQIDQLVGTTPVKSGPAPASKPIKMGSPLVRLVNTKRITLNFEVKDVGPSGLANVELWYTQNCRDWKKYDAPTTSKAYVVEVDEEGMYGFTLVAKSGLGLGKEPPVSGDQPQVWVIVDLTPPEVQLSEVTPNVDSKQQQVTIGWKASDKNFSRNPITLSYAETEAGPWRVMANNLENTGKFTWQMPTGAPARFIVRVEAIDLAGNVARVQSAKPLLLDNNTPTVSITNVEANSGQ